MFRLNIICFDKVVSQFIDSIAFYDLDAIFSLNDKITLTIDFTKTITLLGVGIGSDSWSLLQPFPCRK